MIDIDITIFIQLVNFLIMWMVLNLILFKPIRGIIKKRKDHMDQQMGAIEKFNDDAATKLKDYEKSLAEARASGAEERNKLKEEGSRKEQEILSGASKEASEKVGAARAEIRSEADTAMKALKADVEKMAQKAAHKILGQA